MKSKSNAVQAVVVGYIPEVILTKRQMAAERDLVEFKERQKILEEINDRPCDCHHCAEALRSGRVGLLIGPDGSVR